MKAKRAPVPPSRLDERAIEAAAEVLCRAQFCRMQANRTPEYHDRETAAEMIRAYHRAMGETGETTPRNPGRAGR